MKNVPEITVG